MLLVSLSMLKSLGVIHLMNFTQLDITSIVCRLSRYTQNPNHEHWAAIIRLMKYLRGTMNYGILYSGFPATMEGYNNAIFLFYMLGSVKSSKQSLIV